MLKISYCLCFTNFLVSKPIFNENNTVPIFKRMSIFLHQFLMSLTQHTVCRNVSMPCLGPNCLTITMNSTPQGFYHLCQSMPSLSKHPHIIPTIKTFTKVILNTSKCHFFLQIFHRISSTFLFSIGLNSNLHCLSEAQSTTLSMYTPVSLSMLSYLRYRQPHI